MCVGSIGAGMARTVPELLFWRVMQAFGASSGLSVGIGVLADIFKMEERGSASGIFFGVCAPVTSRQRQTQTEVILCPAGDSSGNVSRTSCRWNYGALLLLARDPIRTVRCRIRILGLDLALSARNVPTGHEGCGQADKQRRKGAMGVAEPLRERRASSESERTFHCKYLWVALAPFLTHLVSTELVRGLSCHYGLW